MSENIEVYKAINGVQSAIGKVGISKDRKNTQQGYAFRGIDDLYGAISPLLSENKLCIIPRYVTRSVIEHESKSGNALFYVTVEGEFDFVSAVDGSRHTARMFGEAMDSADKATNKAASAAFKYLLLQTFCIPTEGDNDADATTPEPKARQTAPPATSSRPAQTNTPKASQQPAAAISGDIITELVCFDDYKEVSSKPGVPKPWKAFFCHFTREDQSDFEAGTFNEQIAENLPVLVGQIVNIAHRAGKKPGTREIIAIDPK